MPEDNAPPKSAEKLSIKELISIRGKVKGHITRFQTFLTPFTIKTENDAIELQTRLDTITPLFTEFDDVQSKIEHLDEATPPEVHDAERLNFETKYFQVVTKAKVAIANFYQVPQASSSATTVSPPLISPGVNISPDQSLTFNAKLPPIQLPEFKGSYSKWIHFKETFDSLINKNTSFSKQQKFYYLQGALKDEAAEVIGSLTITEANYDTAWNLLKDRYENRKAIIHSHLKCIFELSNVTKETHSELRKFTDTFLNHFRSLQNLNEPVDQWSTILIYFLNTKLAITTRKEWEVFSKDLPEPTINDFINFLNQRCRLLETFDFKTANPPNSIKKYPESKSFSHVSTGVPCPLCSEPHLIFACRQFQSSNPNQRFSDAKRLKLCTNCLRQGHSTSDCRSNHSCRYCQKRHHSLLHVNQPVNSNGAPRTNPSSSSFNHANLIAQDSFLSPNPQVESEHISQTNAQSPGVHGLHASAPDTFNLLSTILVNIHTHTNETIQCRALLDSGSQSNFITSRLFDTLNSSFEKINIPISGINQGLTNITKKSELTISSLISAYKTKASFLVIEQITGPMPQRNIDITHLNIPKNIKLADPTFNQPLKIDMLLGVSIFFESLHSNQIKLGTNLPILQNTKFGWIISGTTPIINQVPINSCFLSTSPLQNQLENFWKIEENSHPNKRYSRQELECENHFIKNVKRDESGRFIVQLPLKPTVTELGDSREMAIKRFYNTERRLNQSPALKTEYTKFMDEYLLLGHMSPINPNTKTAHVGYYLPHHAVEKRDSLTTKVRVVFDGSAKTTSGLSLNDVLKIGPTIQNDLFSILVRFRLHKFILIGDIAKMYRQVHVDPSHRDLQRIVWRKEPTDELRHFQLNTVTYGTASASFLATRCLTQVANDILESFPVESNIIQKDFYVDDLMTGSQSIEQLIKIRKNLVNTLNDYGFELRQFMSNNPLILSDLNSRENVQNYVISDSQDTKTLGILYNSHEDIFKYNSKVIIRGTLVTKRSILSSISLLFDPLGLLGPLITQAKIIMQNLWAEKIGWDDPVPRDIYKQWCCFHDEISKISIIKIPRQVTISSPSNIQLHGFSDASMQAYGACLYIRSQNSKGHIQAHLLCSKSRVAPLKTISLPRLELCGALLLSKLVKKTMEVLDINFNKIFYYTDSSIVLAWLAAEPVKWKTFVANRVSEIQQLTTIESWYHISTKINPADIISRGSNSLDSEKSSLWWHGPPFLLCPEEKWPRENSIINFASSKNELPEVKQSTQTLLVVQPKNAPLNIFDKFSTLSRLINVAAYCRRFIYNLKAKKHGTPLLSKTLSLKEREDSINTLIRILQGEVFYKEIRMLRNSQNVNDNNNLISLSPFIDSDGILRVGGRLNQAQINFNHKHPIILPSKHPFTKLVIEHEHIQNLHSGPQSTLSFIRQKYWPINGKSTVKSVLKKCIKCFRVNPQGINPFMGQLPSCRVNPSRIFYECGLDYAGPFQLKDGKYRNKKILKAYICVFVCMSTKAVHIELASELTSECFIAALRRFVSRRGLCAHIHSDNGTNFVGAENELQKIYKISESDQFRAFLTNKHIQWHFIPARSPHFGGIWEAAVKSIKHHLKRVINCISLTYEEFYTILTQVEAILNSRPLFPMSNSPHDLDALTPGHFIIGEALNAAPDLRLEEVPTTRLSKFQHLQKMTQDIWKRWTTEYLHNLQQRSKWRIKLNQGQLMDSLVILIDDNLPPLQWRLGRIVELHPGSDGITRVVSVRTKSGLVKRALSKVCLLPIDDLNNSPKKDTNKEQSLKSVIKISVV